MIVPILLIISTIIPCRTTMIPKDSFCILLFILTALIVIVSLPVPIGTTMGRVSCLVITLLFVIMIRVLGKKGSECFLNPTLFLLGLFTKLLIVFTKLLSFFTKLVELNLSEDWVVDVVIAAFVMVVIVSPGSHQTRVCQRFDTH